MERLAAEDAAHRFDLTAGPLLRFTLIRRGERLTRLMFNSTTSSSTAGPPPS
ncbi:hypothetical protein ACFQ0M_12000 [Kitasatospora aburaviensis]